MRTMQLIIALVVVWGFQGVGRAAEPCCDAVMPLNRAGNVLSGDDAILSAVQDFAVASIHRDVSMLMSLWDVGNADKVSFIQVENELPVVGLSKFRAYYENYLANLVVLSGDVSDVQIQHVGDLAYVVCRYNWVVRSVAGGPSMAQPTRATVILRRQGLRWVYLHLHESITYQP